MTEFPVLLALALIWLLIGLPLSKVAKQKNRSGSRASAPTSGDHQKADPQMKEASEGSGEGLSPQQEYQTIQPTVGLGRHDDSLYRGSRNAETGEGYDPCHDDQMEPLTRISSEPVPRPARPSPALQLDWSANDIVRGVVMSEILNRKNRPCR